MRPSGKSLFSTFTSTSSTAANDRGRHVELLTHQLSAGSLRACGPSPTSSPCIRQDLQRELQVLGRQDFRSILDKVRRDLVTDYLRDTDASLGQIAAMLGYRDQAAFTNAFERWFGMPPGQWRAMSSNGASSRADRTRKDPLPQ